MAFRNHFFRSGRMSVRANITALGACACVPPAALLLADLSQGPVSMLRYGAVIAALGASTLALATMYRRLSPVEAIVRAIQTHEGGSPEEPEMTLDDVIPAIARMKEKVGSL